MSDASSINQVADKALDLTSAATQQVVAEYTIWYQHMVYVYTGWAILCLIVALVGIYLIKTNWKKVGEADEQNCPIELVPFIAGFILAIVMGFIAGINAWNACTAYANPKAKAIEKLMIDVSYYSHTGK